MSSPKRNIKKKANLNTKVGKYFLLTRKGMAKTKAAVKAGYADGSHISQIESSKTYEVIQKRFYRDVLLEQITLEQLAKEQIKNILQDEDKGAKNKAIEQALKKIEPEDAPKENEDRVMVILRKM